MRLGLCFFFFPGTILDAPRGSGLPLIPPPPEVASLQGKQKKSRTAVSL